MSLSKQKVIVKSSILRRIISILLVSPADTDRTVQSSQFVQFIQDFIAALSLFIMLFVGLFIGYILGY